MTSWDGGLFPKAGEFWGVGPVSKAAVCRVGVQSGQGTLLIMRGPIRIIFGFSHRLCLERGGCGQTPGRLNGLWAKGV